MTGPAAPGGEYAVVVPTLGRPGLGVCLRALARRGSWWSTTARIRPGHR
jgi:hypothetical protein